MVEEAGAMMQRCHQDRNKCNAKNSKICYYYKPVPGLQLFFYFLVLLFKTSDNITFVLKGRHRYASAGPSCKCIDSVSVVKYR
jgi:hypothetical protein